jgi:hypothetical protein
MSEPRFSWQDEHKRLEDSERHSRERVASRVEARIGDLERAFDQKDAPEQRADLEVDELYAVGPANPTRLCLLLMA